MFKKILIPTDGSALATQAALEGIELAKKVGAEVGQNGQPLAKQRGI